MAKTKKKKKSDAPKSDAPIENSALTKEERILFKKILTESAKNTIANMLSVQINGILAKKDRHNTFDVADVRNILNLQAHVNAHVNDNIDKLIKILDALSS